MCLNIRLFSFHETVSNFLGRSIRIKILIELLLSSNYFNEEVFADYKTAIENKIWGSRFITKHIVPNQPRRGTVSSFRNSTGRDLLTVNYYEIFHAATPSLCVV